MKRLCLRPGLARRATLGRQRWGGSSTCLALRRLRRDKEEGKSGEGGVRVATGKERESKGQKGQGVCKGRRRWCLGVLWLLKCGQAVPNTWCSGCKGRGGGQGGRGQSGTRFPWSLMLGLQECFHAAAATAEECRTQAQELVVEVVWGLAGEGVL